ncbi:MAG TPA: prolipoprotein diacylglyceryl transferase, partial [Verrucomicrobiales bacterium]|nr:prolipoprotein diacylglyceryl transferase [Verrucomicrobiales bacterium]
EGGMSFHGGFLGVCAAVALFARRNQIDILRLGDLIAPVAPIGIFFGRIANFINGELYGRVTSAGVGMKFPKELLESEDDFYNAMREAVEADPERLAALWDGYLASPSTGKGQLLEGALDASRENPAILEVFGNYVQTRHPSQLYQAFLEGLTLFAILFVLRLRFRNLGHGVITGAFFVLYATFRIVAEQFREPDSAWVIEGFLTKGQFYSIFMYAIGAAFVVAGLKGKTGSLEGQSSGKSVSPGS